MYKEVLKKNSFAENSLSYSRNAKEHGYGAEVAFPVPTFLPENLSGSKKIHSLQNCKRYLSLEPCEE